MCRWRQVCFVFTVCGCVIQQQPDEEVQSKPPKDVPAPKMQDFVRSTARIPSKALCDSRPSLSKPPDIDISCVTSTCPRSPK
ncbi:hypothetical protein NMY22_g18039 [Coprinellus aureogranulatus]|nr:hypothetical protein NMY22_g18039 [Coprinellus aureogranulatus]